MDTSRTLTGVAALLAAALAGCGGSPATSTLDALPPASLQSTEDVARWSWLGPNTLLLVIEEALPAGLFHEEGTGPACPRAGRRGELRTVRGGCFDHLGARWIGSAEWRPAAGVRRAGRYALQGFGIEQTGTCGGEEAVWSETTDATVELSGTEEALSFIADLRFERRFPDPEDGCREVVQHHALEYRGERRQEGGRTTWSGEGRLGISELGMVRTLTEGKVHDPSQCGPEALAGSTTLTAGGDTAVIRYDGDRSCDGDAHAALELNGEPAGEVPGELILNCAASPGAGAAGALPWAVAALAAFAGRRRRRGSTGAMATAGTGRPTVGKGPRHLNRVHAPSVVRKSPGPT